MPLIEHETIGWRVQVDEALRSAEEQMCCDERLAEEARHAARVFQWSRPAVSLGWKQPRPAWCGGAQMNGIELVERPTGGGIAFHGTDVSISLVVPRAWGELRRWMAAACRSAAALCKSYGVPADCLMDEPAVERITYCLTERSSYAVLIAGRKVAGFAARRYPEAWLIQGSLLAGPLAPALASTLPPAVSAALAERAVSLAERCGTPLDPSRVACRWAEPAGPLQGAIRDAV